MGDPDAAFDGGGDGVGGYGVSVSHPPQKGELWRSAGLSSEPQEQTRPWGNSSGAAVSLAGLLWDSCLIRVNVWKAGESSACLTFISSLILCLEGTSIFTYTCIFLCNW